MIWSSGLLNIQLPFIIASISTCLFLVCTLYDSCISSKNRCSSSFRGGRKPVEQSSKLNSSGVKFFMSQFSKLSPTALYASLLYTLIVTWVTHNLTRSFSNSLRGSFLPCVSYALYVR